MLGAEQNPNDMLNWEKHNHFILDTLEAAGLQLDQRLFAAVTEPTNSITAYLRHTNAQWFHMLPGIKQYEPNKPPVASEPTDEYVKNVVQLAAPYARNGIFGVRDYLRGMILHAKMNPDYGNRASVLDGVAEHFTGDRTSSLKNIPYFDRTLDKISNLVDGAEDFEWALIPEDGKIRVCITSVLDDFIIKNDDGNKDSYRSILTSLEDFNFIPTEAIEELEKIINSEATKERDLQEFFEAYPNFLRLNDHREVHPHIYLERSEDGPLIPDFILTNNELQKAALLEIKWSNQLGNIVRRQKNRERFSALVTEAKAQLHKYLNWFDIPEHQERILRHVGMRVYKPKLMVLVGRTSSFTSAIDRSEISVQHPDIEVVTYDDIISLAKERRAFIKPLPIVNRHNRGPNKTNSA